MANSRDLTKRQHYHMRAILKNFAQGQDIAIKYKDGRIDTLTYEDKEFYGYMTWSDETERRYGADIEKKGLGQIRHIIGTQSVSSHEDVSDYHIFWRLRHMYAVSPEPAMRAFDDFSFCTLEEVKDWANRHGKIYINGDGTIDGIFAATLKIKEGLKKYRTEYEGVYWNIGVAEKGGLISADCYSHSLMFPISPNILLCGKRKKNKKPWLMTEEEVGWVNQMAMDECHTFCFSKMEKYDVIAS